MTTLEREKQYIRKWRAKAARGDCSGMSNVAAAYRILENFRLAARWYERAAEHGDGDALTEWGYCLQHGVGTRKDEMAAERAYRAAIASKWITDYAREEAMYHLAVLLLSRQSASSRRAAANLLRAANVDEDYAQAEALLRTIGSAEAGNVCICRRHLRPRLAKRHCPLHGPNKGQQTGCTERRNRVSVGNRSSLARRR
jgi:TPR repeat protein